MKICPMCKVSTCLETDVFCYKDGTPLIDMPKCPECGRELSPNVDKFCPQCGRKAGEALELNAQAEARKNLQKHAPYPFCHGNPTIQDCIEAGYCRRDPNCGE